MKYIKVPIYSYIACYTATLNTVTAFFKCNTGYACINGLWEKCTHSQGKYKYTQIITMLITTTYTITDILIITVD